MKMTGNWRGGRRINSQGYVLIYCPDHPFARQRCVREHRVVMEKHIGRYLSPSEVVHHIDKNKTNNDIKNLMLFSSESEHQSSVSHKYKEFIYRGKEKEYSRNYYRKNLSKGGEQRLNAKLSLEQHEEIRKKYKPLINTHQMLADLYGVHKNTIRRIIKNNQYCINKINDWRVYD